MTDKEHALAIHLLLDGSGSMRHHIVQTKAAANSFLSELGMALTPVLVSVSRFDCSVEPLVENALTYDVPQIDGGYNAMGGTELPLAILYAIKQLDAVSAEHKVVVILTDGRDEGWQRAEVVKQVKERRAQGWLFIFLGCIPDALAEAVKVAIPRDNALMYAPSNVDAVMHTTVFKVFEFFAAGKADAAAFTAEERKALAPTLEELERL